jgi:hypothetical protein
MNTIQPESWRVSGKYQMPDRENKCAMVCTVEVRIYPNSGQGSEIRDQFVHRDSTLFALPAASEN